MSDHQAPHLAHHFDTLEQQKQAATLGMWVFIAQEIMFFGGLFMGYTFYRCKFPEAFAAGSSLLSIGWGGFNTVVLICSSLTMAMGVHAAQLGKNKQVMAWIVSTMVLGTVFLGVKAVEYTGKWHHHLVPNSSFEYHGQGKYYALGHDDAGHAAPAHDEAVSEEDSHGGDSHAATVGVEPNHVRIFYGFYFVMTCTHAIHMIIGMGIMVWLLKLAAANRFSPAYYNPVEIFGLYWHFVDIVWIFLFPLLYLLGRH